MRFLIVLFLAVAAAGQSTTEYPDALVEQSTSLHSSKDFIVHEGESVTISEYPDAPQPYMYRHRKRLLPLLIGGLVFAEAADVYDDRETEIGLRHGVAFEGTTWLIGSHPSFRAAMARDQIMIGVSLIMPTLGWIKRYPVLFGGTLDCPYVVGIVHIRGGNAWRKLLNQQ